MVDKKEEPSKNNNNKCAIAWVTSAMLFLLCCFLTWQLFDKKAKIEHVSIKKEKVQKEKSKVETELEKMLKKYENEKMRKKVEKQKNKIKKLLEKVKNEKYLKYKYKKETETLRGIMKSYLHDIDSLNQVNKKLTQENKQIKNKLGNVKNEKEQIESKAEKMKENIDKASILKTANINATAIKTNLLGNLKKTERASRTEKFKICFTITENRFAKKGKRNIYIRIISPKGKVLSKNKEDNSAQKFEFEGVKGQYTLEHKIDYKGNEINNICLYWDMEQYEDIYEGKYGFKIYESKNLIGSTTLKLK